MEYEIKSWSYLHFKNVFENKYEYQYTKMKHENNKIYPNFPIHTFYKATNLTV